MSSRNAPTGTYWRGETLWGRAEVRGREHRWSLRTDDAVTARRRRKEGHERLLADNYYGDADRSFDEVMAEWAQNHKANVSAETAKRYAVSLGQLRPYLEGRGIRDVDGRLIKEIIDGRRNDGVTNATLKRDLVALNSVLKFALANEWIESNPIPAKLEFIKERRDPIVLPLEKDIKRLILRLPGQLKTLVDVAQRTGCRLGELVSAKREQFDARRGQLTVIGKGNKLRVIDTKPFGAWRLLKSLPAATGAAPLFWHGEAERYANLSSRFAALSNEIAEAEDDFRPFRFHDLRHFHAVQWLKSKRTLYDLQQRLGHTSIKTTEAYLKYLTAEEARAAMHGEGRHNNRHSEIRGN